MTWQQWRALMVVEGWRVVTSDDTGKTWQHASAGTAKGRYTLTPSEALAYWKAGQTPPPF